MPHNSHMKIKNKQRYVGHNEYLLTEKEAKNICRKLPDYGKEKLVFSPEDNTYFWIKRRNFNNDHNFVPIPVIYGWIALHTTLFL
jgi:hypothetical protein